MEQNDKIDVFQDGNDTQIENIFNKAPEPRPTNRVSKKFAMTAIIATFIVLIIFGSAFIAGYFTAKNNGIEADMPMLVQAYDYIKKYYYKDFSWEEFQERASIAFVDTLDNYSFIQAKTASGSIALGFSTVTNYYGESIVAEIYENSPISQATASTHCINPTITKGKSLKTISFESEVDVSSSNIKLDIGDKIYAVSYNGIQPICVDGLSAANLKTIISGSNTLSLYFCKSDGNGGFSDANIYRFDVEKRYIVTKYATLYTPEMINDSTGTTAMIQLSGFYGSAIKDFALCVQAFVDGGYTNLILDLRNNGGGDASILQFIAGCLINGADVSDKDIIYTASKQPSGSWSYDYLKTVSNAIVAYDDEEEETYNIVNLPALVEGFNMTILCNEGTASSSEALIGALQYYNGTKIIGSTTYGKGVGQVVIPYGDYYIYITNSIYYIPTDENGDGVTEWTKSIHEVGFTPDAENKIDNIIRPLSTDKAIARALTLLNG